MSKFRVIGYYKPPGRVSMPGSFYATQPAGISVALVSALEADAEVKKLEREIERLRAALNHHSHRQEEGEGKCGANAG